MLVFVIVLERRPLVGGKSWGISSFALIVVIHVSICMLPALDSLIMQCCRVEAANPVSNLPEFVQAVPWLPPTQAALKMDYL